MADTNLQEELTALMAASSSIVDNKRINNTISNILSVDTGWFSSRILALQALRVQQVSLQNQVQSGIITTVDAAIEMAMIKAKGAKIKKQLVNVVHVKSNGKLRSIKAHGPTSSYPDGYVYTKLEGGVLVKAKDLDALYDRLYDHYFNGTNTCSLRAVFDQALKEKACEENIKEETITKYRIDYHTFITNELSSSDIRQISSHDLKKYTQDLVTTQPLKEKAFLSYKTLLNLIFKYALSHGIIKENPVVTINNKHYLKSCDTDKANAEEKILSEDEIQMLINEVNRRMTCRKWGDYYIFGYAMKFSLQTGTRVGEICGLKWEDIDFHNAVIHIHGQQLMKHQDGHCVLYYVPYTKDECGRSRGGRYFPLTDSLASLLHELKEKQKKLQIDSEYVFCNQNGVWINKVEYGKFFRRLCNRLGFTVTNNHALRMSFNSNVLIPNNVSVADRAKLLGHSVSTNQNYYSFNQKDYVEKAREILNKNSASENDKTTKGTFSWKEGTFLTVDFAEKAKRKSLKSIGFQGFPE